MAGLRQQALRALGLVLVLVLGLAQQLALNAAMGLPHAQAASMGSCGTCPPDKLPLGGADQAGGCAVALCGTLASLPSASAVLPTRRHYHAAFVPMAKDGRRGVSVAPLLHPPRTAL